MLLGLDWGLSIWEAEAGKWFAGVKLTTVFKTCEKKSKDMEKEIKLNIWSVVWEECSATSFMGEEGWEMNYRGVKVSNGIELWWRSKGGEVNWWGVANQQRQIVTKSSSSCKEQWWSNVEEASEVGRRSEAEQLVPNLLFGNEINER